MRLVSVRSPQGPSVAVLTEEGARALEPRAATLAEAIERLMDGGDPRVAAELVADPALGPPLIPGKIVAVGLNYRDHADESGVEAPSSPLLFAKYPSSVVGPGDAIVVDPEVTARADWEVELAVVIGRRMKDVSADEALDYVLGYTAANDVSARDLQFGDGQWTRGKSLDTFCPLGPVIVTPDELGPTDDLRLTTKVNGETMQDDSTNNMIFGVPEILAHCSRHFTLEPGDTILTGTPPGCGEFMDPPRFLSAGDIVEIAVQGIGTISNPVVDAGNGGGA